MLRLHVIPSISCLSCTKGTNCTSENPNTTLDDIIVKIFWFHDIS